MKHAKLASLVPTRPCGMNSKVHSSDSTILSCGLGHWTEDLVVNNQHFTKSGSQF